MIRERASYGHRPITVVVKRAFGTTHDRKRARRVVPIKRLGAASTAQMALDAAAHWVGGDAVG